MRSLVVTVILFQLLLLESVVGWTPSSVASSLHARIVHPNGLLARKPNGDEELWLPENSNSSATKSTGNGAPPLLIFPGGGIYFYWQAGVVCYLNEKGYDLDQCRMSGASAGALTATLAATRVNFYEATDLALTLAAKAKVWDRGSGLQGIWGPLIEEWLHALLPEDEAGLMEYLDEGRLRLLVTPIPSFGKLAISKYENKNDLIRCNMASIHLPWFLDGRLATHFRGEPMIDGSFRRQLGDYCLPSDHNAPIVTLDWNQDSVVKSKASFLSFVQALSPEGILDLLEQGRRFAQIMEEKGDFEVLHTVMSMKQTNTASHQD